VDGRQRRAERSRESVVDAIIAIYEEGELRPGAAMIAERAGLSERSVYRHFEDLEELAAAAIERQRERIAPLLDAPPTVGSRHDRVLAIVDQRLRLHTKAIWVARAGQYVAVRSPVVEAAVERRQQHQRAQVLAHFATDLARVPEPAASEVAQVLDLLLSIEGIDHLRLVSRLGRNQAHAALVRAVEAVLDSVGA